MMAKKTERVGKPVSKSDRWTVRGVPAKLQKAAGDAARARGLTLGQWLGEVLSSALPRRGRAPAEVTERWEQAVEQRLARWLLMAQDRMGSDEFPLTQGFVAMMLGATRPTVTVVTFR